MTDAQKIERLREALERCVDYLRFIPHGSDWRNGPCPAAKADSDGLGCTCGIDRRTDDARRVLAETAPTRREAAMQKLASLPVLPGSVLAVSTEHSEPSRPGNIEPETAEIARGWKVNCLDCGTPFVDAYTHACAPATPPTEGARERAMEKLNALPAFPNQVLAVSSEFSKPATPPTEGARECGVILRCHNAHPCPEHPTKFVGVISLDDATPPTREGADE